MPVLASFAIGQPVLQSLNLLVSFALLRWLDVDQYAMLGMTLAFQSVASQMTDMGFSSSIIALSGASGRDPEVLGGYISSARFWRRRTLFVVLVLAMVGFPLVVWRQPWPFLTKCLLLGSVLLGVCLQSWHLYGAALLANRALSWFYRPQIVGTAARLVVCVLLYQAGLLNAWAAALVAALALGYSGVSYRQAAQAYISEPSLSDPARNTEMRRYLAPLVPGLVFSILQSQILISISAIFGSTQNVAEVSALGRVGHLFIVMGAFVTVAIEPYMAGMGRSLLLRRYLQCLAVALCLAVPLAALGFFWPAPLLWLLGPNYAGLANEIAWVLVTAAINYVGSVMWGINNARKWIFWWGTVAYIVSLLAVQILCAATMDLSQTMSVIWFGLASSIVIFFIHVATALRGFSLSRERGAVA